MIPVGDHRYIYVSPHMRVKQGKREDGTRTGSSLMFCRQGRSLWLAAGDKAGCNLVQLYTRNVVSGWWRKGDGYSILLCIKKIFLKAMALADVCWRVPSQPQVKGLEETEAA